MSSFPMLARKIEAADLRFIEHELGVMNDRLLRLLKKGDRIMAFADEVLGKVSSLEAKNATLVSVVAEIKEDVDFAVSVLSAGEVVSPEDKQAVLDRLTALDSAFGAVLLDAQVAEAVITPPAE